VGLNRKSFLQLWLFNGILLYLVSLVVKGLVLTSWWAVLSAGLVLALVNAIVRPLLIILSLPINILTFGLFTFVVNALMISLTAKLVGGFEVSGFGAAFWGAILVSLFGVFLNKLFFKNIK